VRANGFVVAPEQTTAFLSAISLLGPRDPRISAAPAWRCSRRRRAHGAYNALFRESFPRRDRTRLGDAEDDDIVRVQEEQRGEGELPRSERSQ